MKKELISFYSILLIIFFSCTHLYGQEEWILKFNDGKTIEAELTKKGFISKSKKITYINKATGKKENAASSDLTSMTSIIEGQTLVYKKYKMAYSFGKKIKYNPHDYWAAKIYGTDKMEVYIFVDHDQTMNSKVMYSNQFLATAFKLTSEEYLFEAGPYAENDDVIGYKVYSKLMNQHLKNALMSHCPTFASRLNKKSYYIDEFKKIADDYSAACK